MSLFQEAHIGPELRSFLKHIFQKNTGLAGVNRRIEALCGIVSFFETDADRAVFARHLTEAHALLPGDDRTAYGDFQTRADLAERVVDLMKQRSGAPQVLIEPTFGKGAFIVAALKAFPELEWVVGIEIYKPYVWATKLAILQYFLEHPYQKPPRIELIHQDVFKVDFQRISQKSFGKRVLALGNPPWVTNAQLGAMDAANLPPKKNFRKLSGLDALTGKSNFDIGESIVLMLLQAFQQQPGSMAFLVKNTVIKNLLFEQQSRHLRIGRLEQYAIDAQKAFGASVEASLLVCDFDHTPAMQCTRTDWEASKPVSIRYGWEGSKFVSDLEKYCRVQAFDGACPLEWRQGLKHDCAAVMELERVGDHFASAADPKISIEDDLVFGLLKSSDLKGNWIAKARRYTIVTQRKIGQDTSYIRERYPLTYRYLSAHWERFARRKSSIYQNKPPFSIFGIGDYAFLPYKVAISGLYKMPVFSLVLPENGKPLMLDDTCYFIGFEQYSPAAIAFALLNAPLTAELLEAITFADAKRRFTKEILQRIDLVAIARAVPFSQIQAICRAFRLERIPCEQDYTEFLDSLSPQTSPASAQLALF